MQVSNVSQNFSRNRIANKNKSNNNIAFKAAYVPTTEKYAAEHINKHLAEFNNNMLAKILPDAIKTADKTIKKVQAQLKIKDVKIKNAHDLATKYNCFVLAGGPGSRFKELSDSVGKINNEQYNKICVPFVTKKDTMPFTMIDPALTLKAVFAAGKKAGNKTGKDYGYQPYTITEERGNFWHIVKHYMDPKNKIKDTVIISGDNAFDMKTEHMLETIVRMKEQGQHLAMFGVKKTPEEVQGKFGVLGVQQAAKPHKNIMALNAFAEKPSLAVAQLMAKSSDGMNIANTGALVISKEAMTEIVKIARKDEALKKRITKMIEKKGEKATPAMKNLLETGNGLMNTFSRGTKETDRFDFSTVQSWILNNMYTKDQIMTGHGPMVQMIDSKKWSDVGEPKAMFEMIHDIAKKGKFLKNFSKDDAKEIQNAFKNKAKLTGVNKALIVSARYENLKEVPKDLFLQTIPVEGVKIIG